MRNKELSKKVGNFVRCGRVNRGIAYTMVDRLVRYIHELEAQLTEQDMMRSPEHDKIDVTGKAELLVKQELDTEGFESAQTNSGVAYDDCIGGNDDDGFEMTNPPHQKTRTWDKP